MEEKLVHEQTPRRVHFRMHLYRVGTIGLAFQLILAGSCGILGILWLGWSSEQEFAFIVI